MASGANGSSTSALDIVVSGGRVIDGCGNPWFRADVGVAGGTVVAVSAPGTLHGRRTIAADDRFVVPGFVDPHTHSDLSLLVYRHAETAVRQGVTTHVTGNCGMSPAPLVDERRGELIHLWDHYGLNHESIDWAWRTFGEYLDALESGGLGINVVPLVGHGAVRVAVLGPGARVPSAAELTLMERFVDGALRDGARGLSTGLVYPPGCYAQTDEIVALCRVVAAHHGIYASHVRGERETILPAVGEAVEIGRVAGLPVEVSHNAPKWGAPDGAAANLGLIEEARLQGLDVTADNDVHTELAPRLSRALPQPLLELDTEDLLARLRDPTSRERLQEDVREDRLPGAGYTGLVRHGAWERITVLWAPGQPHLAGRSIAAIAAERETDPFATLLDLIVEEEDRIVGIFEYIDIEDVRALLCHRLTMCCSDGLVMAPPDESYAPGSYWPCSYGEYPGILERFVRGDRLLPLEEAIRKMTSFPAQRFGLFDRGVLRPGMRADIVVFDLERVRDRATEPRPFRAPFTNIPPRLPEGMDTVIVNGEAVLDEGIRTGALPGAVLRSHDGGRSPAE